MGDKKIFDKDFENVDTESKIIEEKKDKTRNIKVSGVSYKDNEYALM